MKILILGGSGMIGHYLVSELAKRHDLITTYRQSKMRLVNTSLIDQRHKLFTCDVTDLNHVEKIISEVRPEAVINAAGMTKQLINKNNVETAIYINSLFPFKLARLCEKYRARLMLLSTDCVFSGNKGMYTESDQPDAIDVYGRTKYLGEVEADHVINLRKSTIGLEKSSPHGLLEWFLSQTGQITGFGKAIFSGLITAELTRVIEMILLDFPTLDGTWNISASPISKYELLSKLKYELKKTDIEIIRDEAFECDRSLDGSRFQRRTGWTPRSWDDMVVCLGREIQNRVQDHGSGSQFNVQE